MKNYILTLLILCLITHGYCQIQNDEITGKWSTYKKGFDKNNDTTESWTFFVDGKGEIFRHIFSSAPNGMIKDTRICMMSLPFKWKLTEVNTLQINIGEVNCNCTNFDTSYSYAKRLMNESSNVDFNFIIKFESENTLWLGQRMLIRK